MAEQIIPFQTTGEGSHSSKFPHHNDFFATKETNYSIQKAVLEILSPMG